MPTTDTVVIGAGHAGLAVSRLLTEAGVDHVVLDRGRVAERWRTERWDSLHLLTPAWMTRLPHFQAAGTDPDAFIESGAFVEHLERYAASFGAPVVTGAHVRELVSTDAGYRIDTDAGTWRARHVVIATGPHGRPRIPAGLDPARVLPASAYRNPDALAPGGVLVVGASSSGIQIADELARSGRDVTLAVGRHTRMPRRYRGMDVYWWLQVTGRLARTIDTMPDQRAARLEPSLQLVGTSGPPEDLDLGVLQHRGVRLVGRVTASTGGGVDLGDDLGRSVADAERRLRRLLGSFDDLARCLQWDRELLPPEPLPARRRHAVLPAASTWRPSGSRPSWSRPATTPTTPSCACRSSGATDTSARCAAARQHPGLYVVGPALPAPPRLRADRRRKVRRPRRRRPPGPLAARPWHALRTQVPAGGGPVNGYDAVVVGGRVAGAATALLLAREGLKVVIVERGRPGSDTVSTHAFMRAGVLQLSRWGLLEAIEGAGTPPVRRTVFHHPGLEPVTVTHQTPRRCRGALRTAPLRARRDPARRGPRGRRRARARDGHRAVARRRRPRGRRTPRRAGTVGADPARPAHHRRRRDRLRRRPPGRGARSLQQGRHASAVLYRYYEGLPTDGLRVVLRTRHAEPA